MYIRTEIVIKPTVCRGGEPKIHYKLIHYKYKFFQLYKSGTEILTGLRVTVIVLNFQ